MRSFKVPEAGAFYNAETKAKCYWEIVLTDDDKVQLIQRGGPANIRALEISLIKGTGESWLEISDCWDWGD